MSLDLMAAEDWLPRQPPQSLDLLLGSPPYAGKHRRYPDLPAGRQPPGDWRKWAAWMFELTEAACRAARIVFWVVDSPRREGGEYLPAVERLQLYVAECPGLVLRTPHVWHKNGAPGGPYWPGHDYELVVGATARDAEFVYDPAAIGHPARFDSGPGRQRTETGGRKAPTRGVKKGALARPRDVLTDFFRVTVGGGHMGRSVGAGEDVAVDAGDDKLATAGQAPYPWWLATRFVAGFSRPGGAVGDCFAGTGTTLVAAHDAGRTFRGCELSPSQVTIARERAARLGHPAGPSEEPS